MYLLQKQTDFVVQYSKLWIKGNKVWLVKQWKKKKKKKVNKILF